MEKKFEVIEHSDMLKSLKFTKTSWNIDKEDGGCYIYSTKINNGRILVLQKTSGETNIFPVINNKIGIKHELDWLKFYQSNNIHASNDSLLIKPTQIGKSDEVYLLNQFRGQENMSHHFGHFLLDAIPFYAAIISKYKNQNRIKFIDNIQRDWQLSLLSYIFPAKLKFLDKACISVDKLASILAEANKPTGIIKHLLLIECSYEIIRPSAQVGPGNHRQLGKMADNYFRKYRLYLENSMQNQIASASKNIALLTRRNTQYPRWINDIEALNSSAKLLNLNLSIIYPEKYDPVELAILLASYKYIFAAPGSAILLPLLMRNSYQKFFMPTNYILKSSNHYPEYLVDFQAFSNSLKIIPHSCILSESGWNSEFIVDPEICTQHIASSWDS